MDDSRPTRAFEDPWAVLRSHVARVVQGPVDRPDELTLVYRVSGGPPGKRLLVEVRVTGAGRVTYERRDDLNDGQPRSARMILPEDERRSLFQRVQASGLLEQRETGRGFLPDSVIASVGLEATDAKLTYYFLAQPEQQRAQGREPPSPIRALAPLLERLAESLEREPHGREAGTRRRGRGQS